jgi:L-rhamnonate dehydratase
VSYDHATLERDGSRSFFRWTGGQGVLRREILRITDVEAMILDSGADYGAPDQAGEAHGPRYTALIRVDTDAGVSGFADVDSNPWIVKAVVDSPAYIPGFSASLKDAVVGEDPFNLEYLWDKMYQHSWYHGRRGVALHAISGIDIALWDIVGKALGRPIYELLGGRRREKIEAYASTLFRAKPDHMHEAVRSYLEQGFRAIKFGWGSFGQDPSHDVTLLAAARDAAGDDVELMVDGHIRGNFKRVLRTVRAIEALRPRWVEEPISADEVDAIGRLSDLVETDIASGEQLSSIEEFEELMTEGRVDIVQPDLSRCGGFTAIRRIAALARQRRAEVVPHAWVSDILTAASLHVNAWLPSSLFVEFNVTRSPIVRSILREPLQLVDGYLRVPEGPGLGIEIEESVVSDHRIA